MCSFIVFVVFLVMFFDNVGLLLLWFCFVG